MAKKKRKTLKARLEEAKKRLFVGRQAQIAQFQANLKPDVDDDDFVFLFNVFGQGGVGKTTLVNRYQSIAQKEAWATALVDFDNNSLMDELTVMHEIAKQLEQQDVRLKQFSKQYKTYLQEKGKLESDPEKPKGTLGKMVKGAIKISSKAGAEFIPGAGIVKDYLPTNSIAEMAGAWADFAAKKITNKDELELVLSPLKILTPLWVEDLNNVSKEVALFLDTYETAPLKFDQWWCQVFRGEYGDFPTILLTISGQQPLDINRWGIFGDMVANVPLDVFTEEEAGKYLVQGGISCTDTRKAIVSLSQCLPVYLTLLSDGTPSSPDEITDSSNKIIERFLKNIKDSIKRNLALKVALSRQFNQDVVACLLPEDQKENAAEYFQWLIERPFIKQQGNAWTYHQLVRKIMLRYQMAVSIEGWEVSHRQLMDWYMKRGEQRQITENQETWLKDEQWCQLRAEVYFHALCYNYKQYIPAFIRDVATLLRLWNEEMAMLFAQTLHQVERMTKLPLWGELLLDGIDALFHQEDATKNKGLYWFQKVNRSKSLDNKEDRSFCFFWEAFFETDNDNAIVCYEKSLELNPDKDSAYYNMGIAYKSKGDYDNAIVCYKKSLELNPNKDSSYYNMGIAYKSKGDYDNAIVCYKKSLELNPNKNLAYNNMGNAYESKGDNDKAIVCYKKSLELNPNKDSVYYNMGIAYESKGDYDNAIVCYEKSLELNPNKDSAYNNMGNAYGSKRDYASAIVCYKKSLELNPNQDEAHYNMGIAYESKGDYASAIVCYKKSLELNPNQDSAYYNMGIAYESKGDYANAIVCYKKSLELNPNQDSVYYNMGIAYKSKGDYDKAIVCYKKSLELNPNKDSVYYNMGIAYKSKGDYDKAIVCYKKSLELNPNKDEAYYNMGIAYKGKRDNANAIICYKKSLELNPNQDSAYYNMGNAYKSKGDYANAIVCYEKSLELNPNKDSAYYNMGNAYKSKGDYANAIVCYKKSLELNPNKDSAYNNMGNAYGSKGDNDNAIVCYKKSLELNPNKDSSYYNMGNAYESKGDYDNAIVCYKKSLELNPNKDSAYNNMGNAYGSKGDYDNAIICYKKSLKLNPNQDEAHYNMGNAYESKGDYDNAIVCYKKSLKLNPNQDSAYNNMGITYGSKGDYANAIVCYEKSLELNPNQDEAYNNMGGAYDSTGNYEKAIECYKKGLELKPNDIVFTHSIGWTYLLAEEPEKAQIEFFKVWELSEFQHSYTPMNIGHTCLLNKDETKAIEWYKKSIPLWEDLNVFWKGMESDFEDLKMESKGISRETYNVILEELRQEKK